MFSCIDRKLLPAIVSSKYSIYSKILSKHVKSLATVSSQDCIQANQSMNKDTQHLADCILSNHNSNSRLALSRAITLIESKSHKHQIQAELLLNYLLNYKNGHDEKTTNNNKDCFRIGFAGPPGAGKSTLIETLGKYVLNQSNEENKLAVLCIDPSSSISGGSILGDKTRMIELSKHPNAYIRPSPTSGTLGGLGTRTNDVIQLVSSSSIYNYCFIETVGVGQSEIEIDQVVDLVVLVIPPAGGDELQGVKKGIVEIADLFIVNKADGRLETQAKITASEYKNALHLLHAGKCSVPKVVLVSAHTKNGIQELWNVIRRIQEDKVQSGLLLRKRQKQNQYWMWKYVQDLIIQRTTGKGSRSGGDNDDRRQHINDLLVDGKICPRAAARQLLECIM